MAPWGAEPMPGGMNVAMGQGHKPPPRCTGSCHTDGAHPKQGVHGPQSRIILHRQRPLCHHGCKGLGKACAETAIKLGESTLTQPLLQRRPPISEIILLRVRVNEYIPLLDSYSIIIIDHDDSFSL